MTTYYWDQRIERLNREVFRDSESYVRELRKIYDTEAEKIQDSIYSQLLKLQEEAGEISLAEAKKLLNDREKKIFKDSLDDFIKKATGKINVDTERELNIISRRVRISRLQAMEVELKKTVAGLMSREEKGLFAHLGGTYEKRYYKELYELQRITGYKSVQSVNKSELNTLIKNPWTSDGQEFSERIWGRGEKLTTSLRDNLIRDIARGSNPKESARNIQRLFDVSKASASRLVFTETAAVNAKATQDSYEKLGVKQYQILATLDLKTSDICRSMDSKIFDYKDYKIGITAPPFHPNCRSDTVPYFGDEFEKEIDQGIGRMARDPKTGKSEPVENLSYEDWYKKYVDNENYNNIKKKESINFFDSIDEWKEVPKEEAKAVEDLQIWEHEGKEYKVDGKYVVLDYSKHEKEVAVVIAQKYGKDVKMAPRVLNPPGIKTPDYIINGEKWDLKVINSRGRNAFYNTLRKNKKQADRFIFELKDSFEEEWLNEQINSIFASNHYRGIKEITIYSDGKIIKAMKRE